MLALLLILPVPVLLLLGLALARRGFVGVRVGDAPHCTACGYNLTGVGIAPGTCPECGTSLAKRRAVTAGVLVRSQRLGWAGVCIMMLGAALVYPLASVIVRADVWLRVAPTWVLIRSLEANPDRATLGSVANATATSGTPGDALSEVLRRLDHDDLSAGEVHRLEDLVRRYNAGPERSSGMDRLADRLRDRRGK